MSPRNGKIATVVCSVCKESLPYSQAYYNKATGEFKHRKCLGNYKKVVYG